MTVETISTFSPIKITNQLSLADYFILREINQRYLYAALITQSEDISLCFFGVAPQHNQLRSALARKTNLSETNITIGQLSISGATGKIYQLILEHSPAVTLNDSLANVKILFSKIDVVLFDTSSYREGISILFGSNYICSYRPTKVDFVKFAK